MKMPTNLPDASNTWQRQLVIQARQVLICDCMWLYVAIAIHRPAVKCCGTAEALGFELPCLMADPSALMVRFQDLT